MKDWIEYVNCGGSGCDDILSSAHVFLGVEDWRFGEGATAMLCGTGEVSHGEDSNVTLLAFSY